MPGPAPKHPSALSRARDAKRGGDFRQLAAVPDDAVIPQWPLGQDLSQVALLETNRDRVANLQMQIESEDDGRKRGRLQRELNRLELAITAIELELEQARDSEVAMWNDLWAMPQAVLWSESHAYREVAQYVRWKIRAENGNLDAGKEARMLSDRLGLNPLALLRLRAEVERVDEVVDQGNRRRSGESTKPKKKSATVDPRTFLDDVG